MSSMNERRLLDRMRGPLREIAAAFKNNTDFEENGIAEMRLHDVLHGYIIERAKDAGVRWRDDLVPTSTQWAAAVLRAAPQPELNELLDEAQSALRMSADPLYGGVREPVPHATLKLLTGLIQALRGEPLVHRDTKPEKPENIPCSHVNSGKPAGLPWHCYDCGKDESDEMHALLAVEKAAKARFEVWSRETYGDLDDAFKRLESVRSGFPLKPVPK